MKKALIAAAVAGAFAAPSAMAAELSTNIYWSTAIGIGEDYNYNELALMHSKPRQRP